MKYPSTSPASCPMNELRAFDLAAGDPATWRITRGRLRPRRPAPQRDGVHDRQRPAVRPRQLRGGLPRRPPGGLHARRLGRHAGLGHRAGQPAPLVGRRPVVRRRALPPRHRPPARLHPHPRPAHRRPRAGRALGGALGRGGRAGLRALRRLLLPAPGSRPRQHRQRPSRAGADARRPGRPRREHRPAALAGGRPGRRPRGGLAAHPHPDDPDRPGQRLRRDAGRRRG